jgi:phenylacetate-coenzyme A ligase PaaK-like adenylate-forming protein
MVRRAPGRDFLQGSLDWIDVASRAGELWWTRSAGPQAVANAANRRLANLERVARARSPFYERAWRSLPRRLLALHELPVVTKRALMASFDDWATDRRITRDAVLRFLAGRDNIGDDFLDAYVVWRSSGSTGEPGIYVQDRDALATYDALLAVQLQSLHVATRYAWSVVAEGGRAALVAATGDHFASIASWQRVCRGLPWPSARAFSVMDPMPVLVEKLNAFAPSFLASYPTTLALLAEEKRAGRLSIAPSCIWSGGEFLSDAAYSSIETAFDAVAVNEYGASECMSIAFSCPHRSLHVNADWVLLEPVDSDYRPVPPGERSHTVLLTNLANVVQPIIRYDLGDSITVTDRPCRCGSALPVILAEGRCDDVLALRARDGSLVRVSPLALTTVVEDATTCHPFQLVQTAPDRLVLRLAATSRHARDEARRAARRALNDYLAQQSLGNVRVVDDDHAPMPDARSGKLREVIRALS